MFTGDGVGFGTDPSPGGGSAFFVRRERQDVRCKIEREVILYNA